MVLSSIAFWPTRPGRYRRIQSEADAESAGGLFWSEQADRGADTGKAYSWILRRIRELKAAGHTLREIAAELNRQGYRTRRGTAWRFQYVADALRKEVSVKKSKKPTKDRAAFERR